MYCVKSVDRTALVCHRRLVTNTRSVVRSREDEKAATSITVEDKLAL